MDDAAYVGKIVREALEKGRRYVEDPSDAPEGVQVQEGPRGGHYYEVDESGEEEPQGDNGGDDSDTPNIEVQTTDAKSFNSGVRSFIEEDPEMGAFLSEHPPEELEDHTLLSNEDGSAGVAVSPEGDIQNLFATEAAEKGAGRALLEEAIEAGGNTLDCYDGFLRDLYGEYGFRETGRIEFNPDYAPDGWNFDEFGQPDVVFMSYQPGEDLEETDKYYASEEWDNAKDDSRRTASNGEGRGEKGRRMGGTAQVPNLGTSKAYRGDLESKDLIPDNLQ